MTQETEPFITSTQKVPFLEPLQKIYMVYHVAEL